MGVPDAVCNCCRLAVATGVGRERDRDHEPWCRPVEGVSG